MRAKNRLSPYPILCNYSDDYKEGEFNTIINYEKSEYGDNIKIFVEFNLNSDYLQTAINNGKANYVTHIECAKSSFRQIESSNCNLHEISLPLDKVVSDIEVSTFIIATEDFEYYSEEFNEDYEGYYFIVNKGNILAVGTANKISVSNKSDYLESFSSILKIVKIDAADKAMVVDTDDDDCIKIKLSKKVCNQYKLLGSSIVAKTCFSLILFPALCEVIKRMVLGQDNPEFIDKHWYKVLSKSLEINKMPLANLSLYDNSIIDACQKIFKDPIARAFDELEKKLGDLNED